MPVVTINGNDYVTTNNRLRQSPFDPQTPGFRTTAKTRRSDNQDLNFSVYDRWADMGIFWHRQRRDRDDLRGVGGIWKSTAETRFDDCMYSAILEQVQTHTDPDQHGKRFLLSDGTYLCFFEEDYDNGEITNVTFASWSPDTWTNILSIVAGVSNAAGQRFWDVVVHKNELVLLTNGDGAAGSETEYQVQTSSDGGASWTLAAQPSTTYATTTTVTRRNNFDDDEGRLFDDGNDLWVAIYDRAASGQVKFLTSTNGGSNWAEEAAVSSGSGPKALLRYRDLTGASSMVGILAEGIYALDKTSGIASLILALDGDPNTGRWSVVGDDGRLYVPLGSGDIYAINITADGVLDVENIGPLSAHDGMVTEWQGHANYLMSGNSIGGFATPWLWVAYGGHASSKTATILCYDYKRSREQGFPVWHCFHDAEENSITGMGQNVDIYMMGLSTENDSVPRLHVVAEHATDSLMFHFEQPLVCHPTSGISDNYIATTFVRFAIDDHGDPHTPGALYQGRLEGLELDTAANNQEKVSHFFSVNGTDPPATDLGDYFSDVRSLTYASGAGVSARTSMHELRLIRGSGDTTERAIVTEFDVGYRKRLPTKNRYVLEIDLVESAKLLTSSGVKTTETVITNLDTIRDSDISVSFTLGKAAAVFVDMVVDESLWDLELYEEGGGDGLSTGSRTGMAHVVLKEIL